MRIPEEQQRNKSNFRETKFMAGEVDFGGIQMKSLGRQKLEKWLNHNMKIKMSDGRTLIGIFLCTDRDGNIILGTCEEYIKGPDCKDEEPRILGLAMVPGHHIKSVQIDQPLQKVS